MPATVAASKLAARIELSRDVRSQLHRLSLIVDRQQEVADLRSGEPQHAGARASQ